MISRRDVLKFLAAGSVAASSALAAPAVATTNGLSAFPSAPAGLAAFDALFPHLWTGDLLDICFDPTPAVEDPKAFASFYPHFGFRQWAKSGRLHFKLDGDLRRVSAPLLRGFLDNQSMRVTIHGRCWSADMTIIPDSGFWSGGSIDLDFRIIRDERQSGTPVKHRLYLNADA